MKKTRLVLIIMTLLVFILAACSNDKENDQLKVQPDSSNTKAPSTNNHEETKQEEELPEEDLYEEAEQILIYELDGVRVYHMGCKQELGLDPYLDLYVENDMDIEVSIYLEDISIDSIMFLARADIRVPAKGSAYGQTYMYDPNFELSGITDPEEFEFHIRIINAKEHYNKESEAITVNLLSPDKSPSQASPGPLGMALASDKLLYEDRGLKLYFRDYEFIAMESLKVNFWFENDSDTIVEVFIKDASLNGKDKVLIFNQRLGPHKASYAEIYFLNEELQNLAGMGPYKFEFKFKCDFFGEKGVSISEIISLDFAR